jgi:hypothetical protein
MVSCPEANTHGSILTGAAVRAPARGLRGAETYLPRFHVSEEDAFDIMMEALSRQPAAADDKAEGNIRGVTDTTAQKPTDGDPVTGGSSVE